MPPYNKDVKDKLGDSARDLLIQYVREGKISKQQAEDFASLLGENIPHSVIFSAHKQRVNDSGWNQTELRYILEQWFCEELFKLNRDDALAKLSKIFYDPVVNLRPLAHDIRKLMDKAFLEAFLIKEKAEKEKKRKR